MRSWYFTIHTFLCASILLLICCTNLYAQEIFLGDSVDLGDGTVYTWVKINTEGVPEEIGVTMTEQVFSNLPVGAGEFSLILPDVAVDSLFKHILFDWNPQGHPPNNIYGLPHFDFHFYIVTEEEREAIQAGIDTFPVAAENIPLDYRSLDDPPFSVPNMGVHWIDSLSSEWQGETFTETFIYGFYHGDMYFIEPMITVDYFQTNLNVTLKIKQPQSFQKDGYYPTNYSIEYDAVEQVYNIIIKDFVFSGPATSVENDGDGSPSEFLLFQNYPNPFNPSTTIKFTIPSNVKGETSNVILKVYDILGNQVATLVSKELSAGEYEVSFDASRLSSGLYFYTLQSGSYTVTRKMVLLR